MDDEIMTDSYRMAEEEGREDVMDESAEGR